MYRMTRGRPSLARLGLAFLFLISSHQTLFVLASVSKEVPAEAAKSSRALASTTDKPTTAIASGYRRSLTKINFELIFTGKLEPSVLVAESFDNCGFIWSWGYLCWYP